MGKQLFKNTNVESIAVNWIQVDFVAAVRRLQIKLIDSLD